MTKALVDVNKKMVHQMKKKKNTKEIVRATSPVAFNIPTVTPMSRPAPLSAVSVRTNVSVEG